MINLPTKFEVPVFTHYVDMKAVAKCRKSDGLGGYGSFKIIGNITV